MKRANLNAVYVWCNSDLYYPKEIALKIGRDDLEIVPPSWLSNMKWFGRVLTDIVLDHSTLLTDREMTGYHEACYRIQRNDNADS